MWRAGEGDILLSLGIVLAETIAAWNYRVQNSRNSRYPA